MADSNHTRRDDYMEFSENDPFAELTRIMGHDPREAQPAVPVQGEAVAVPSDSDLDLDLEFDLERELAADLDFSDFDEPDLQADWRMEGQVEVQTDAPHVTADQQVFPATIEQPSPDLLELDAEFDDFFAAGTPEAEPVVASYEAYQPVIEPEMTVQGHESLDDVLERELLAEQASWDEPDPAPAYSEPAYDAPVAYEAQSYEGEPVYEAAAFPEEPISASTDAHVDAQADIAGDDWALEAEFDVDFLERELATSTASDQLQFSQQPEFEPPHGAMTPPASFEAESFPEPDEPAVFDTVYQAAEDEAERPLSLEEELHLLLADEPLPAAPRIEAQSQAVAATNFGRANFAAAQPRSMAEETPAYSPAPIPAEAYQPPVEAEFAEPVMKVEAEFAEPVMKVEAEFAEPVMEVEAEFAETAVEVADDDFGDIFGDDFVLHLDDEVVEDVPAGAVEATAPEQPEIETVEVAETVPPVTDDLDIPEIDYGAVTASAPDFHDDFQSDFDHLFGNVTTGEARPAELASNAEPVAGQQNQYDDLLDDTQWQTAQAASAAGYAPDSSYDPNSSYAYETDLEQAIAMSAYEEEPVQPSSRRRGLFVAAAVGGIVALAGVGVFGMSMLGGGSDSPAIVRADPEPMKMRPENPGGTTVPNQDSQVYQRVSGAGSDAGPLQEQLITSAEEPVDVVARTVTPQEPSGMLVPGVNDDAPEAEAGSVKSEERIEQAPQATSPVEAQETAMVTPRRVRTMVVRPDGTMVPREELEPAPVVAEQVNDGAGQAVAADEATALAPMDQPVQSADTIDDGPVLDMPQTVSVVPTQRSQATQPAAAPQPAAPQPAAPAQIAAAPVAAPASAAASSEWSMQIASQPTAEGAQASYQDLARRYGSVLEGRGVSIVRADIDGRGTYYRVRIPASSRDEAIQLCTRYKAVGGSCFVSR